MATTHVHLSTSRRLLKQAEREYRAGRMMQASARGWQAVAHAIGNIARQRNWPHETEADLFQATTKVAHELDNLEVLDLTLSRRARWSTTPTKAGTPTRTSKRRCGT